MWALDVSAPAPLDFFPTSGFAFLLNDTSVRAKMIKDEHHDAEFVKLCKTCNAHPVFQDKHVIFYACPLAKFSRLLSFLFLKAGPLKGVNSTCSK